MAIKNTTQTVQQAAMLLAEMDWLDQDIAQQLLPMSEAVVNMFMVVYYQAEMGLATPADFQEARIAVMQTL